MEMARQWGRKGLIGLHDPRACRLLWAAIGANQFKSMIIPLHTADTGIDTYACTYR